MDQKDFAVICLGLAVLCFALQAFGVKVAVHLVWLGVAFLIAGVYFVPAL